MLHKKGFLRSSLWATAILLILMGPLLLGPLQHQAEVQAIGCWQASITEQWTNLDLVGSVLRVSVQGTKGLPVVVRSTGSFQTVGYTGTKPEYGPHVAEFAPLSRGTYFVEPEGLGIVFRVWLDGKNYTRIDFVPVPCDPTPTPRPATATPRPTATATRRPAAAATPSPVPTQRPQPAGYWQGRVAQHLKDLSGRYFATIAVRVIGRPAGQQVEIRSGGWSSTCKTGTKPEVGPDACEFGALKAGTYRLTPTDLGTHLDVMVDYTDYVLVEFHYVGPPPNTRWVASIMENTSGSAPTEHANSAIAVIVAGRPWHKVDIRTGGWSSTCTTGYKPDVAPDACEFGGLRASTYTITPHDLGVSAKVTMDGWGWALVRFYEVPVAPPKPTQPPAQPTATATARKKPLPTAVSSPVATTKPGLTAAPGWQGWVISNTSGQQGGSGVSSVIVVRVINYGGVPVDVTGGGSWNASCITGTKPEYGPDACEFGGLWPGIYTLRPRGADIQLAVEMDGLGTAFVDFAPP